MQRILVITDLPKSRAYFGFALDLLGIAHDVASCLTVAAVMLDRADYDCVFLDLRWDGPTAPSMTAWVQTHVQSRGVRTILTSETPIARDMHFALRLKAAIILGRAFDFKDVVEALGVTEPVVSARRAG